MNNCGNRISDRPKTCSSDFKFEAGGTSEPPYVNSLPSSLYWFKFHIQSRLTTAAASHRLNALDRLFPRYLFEPTGREIENKLVIKPIGQVFISVPGNLYLKTMTV